MSKSFIDNFDGLAQIINRKVPFQSLDDPLLLCGKCYSLRECSGSVVECLTGDRGVYGFEPHWRHCIVVLEQDTFIIA